MGAPILALNGITKTFVGTVALHDVSFCLFPGEILGVLGENGAGKSTMMKILCGVYPCDSYQGEIVLDGQLRQFRSPKDAELAGIAMIPQELSLELDLSVTENIMLGKLPRTKAGLIDWKQAHQKARQLMAQLDVSDIDVKLPARHFNSSVQQLISIARALYREPRILILDEPTSCLTENETRVLFQAVRNLQRQGMSCLYISHKLNEVFELCDRVVILRDGRYISEHVREKFDSTTIIHDIVGHKVEDFQKEDRQHNREEALRVEHFYVPHPYTYGQMIVEDVSFSLYKGEILGLCGLVGSGRSELLGAVFGALPKSSGEVYVDGKKVSIKKPSDAKKLGIGMVTEERKKDGFIGCLSVRENISVTVLDMLTKWGFLNLGQERMLAKDSMEKLNIKAPDMETKITSLSGGNQQKVIVAKWLATEMKVLILDEPTRGIDVGTKQEMYQLIQQLADRGVSIIVVSSEVQELCKLCDRFIVLAGGKVRSELKGGNVSEADILKACSNL